MIVILSFRIAYPLSKDASGANGDALLGGSYSKLCLGTKSQGLSYSWSTSNVETALFDFTHVRPRTWVQQRKGGEAPDRVAKDREFVGSRLSRYLEVGEYITLINDGLRSAVNLHLQLSGYLVLYALTCNISTKPPLGNLPQTPHQEPH